MDAHRIYYFKVVHMFKCILNIGPRAVNMLRAILIRHCLYVLTSGS